MTEFITKEEIKQWRSSVEKITLEEYAARLGKTIQEEKQTNDLVDILYREGSDGKNATNNINNKEVQFYTKPEKIESIIKPAKVELSPSKPVETTIPAVQKTEEVKIVKTEELKPAEKIVKIEKIEPVKKVESIEKIEKVVKTEKPVAPAPKVVEQKEKVEKIEVEAVSTSGDINITFKKPLTDRELSVLEHLKQNRGKIVFAKDLAVLLDLKRDYIYKYIKNLRAKIVEDVLQNSEQGGFILK